ncbi:MAG: YceI family protein [Pseudomonadota bacterium]
MIALRFAFSAKKATAVIVPSLVSLALIGCAQQAASDDQRASAANEASATAPQGAWRLDETASRIAFVSVKAGEVAEVHSFKEIKGGVDADGAAEIVIPLDSVETNIDIRNDRMREILFETGDYPVAKITAAIDMTTFASLTTGARAEAPTTVSVDLHGASVELDADLFVTRISEDRVSVETAAPIVIDAATFGLEEGVEALREIAGLPSIAPLAPVTASLVFEAN